MKIIRHKYCLALSTESVKILSAVVTTLRLITVIASCLENEGRPRYEWSVAFSLLDKNPKEILFRWGEVDKQEFIEGNKNSGGTTPKRLIFAIISQKKRGIRCAYDSSLINCTFTAHDPSAALDCRSKGSSLGFPWVAGLGSRSPHLCGIAGSGLRTFAEIEAHRSLFFCCLP